MKDVERFMKHYFLIAKDVGDLTAILCAALEDQQAKPAPVLSRMMARLRPRGRRALPETEDFVDDNNRLTIADKDVFARRSDQPDPHVPARAEAQPGAASRRHARGEQVAEADRPEAAARSRGQPAVPRNPHLARRRDRPAAHERDRRARPLRARVRPRRRDDAVQHVSSLHGRRAPAALHRHPCRYRARRQRRIPARQRSDEEDPARASHPAVCRAVPARHRQGPDRGSFDRRRAHRARVLPAHRPVARRHRDGRLADRAASRHVDDRAVARPVGPQDHREFRRRGAIAGADEAPHHPHHRGHPRGRSRRVERLEGAAFAHALLRDRAGADRRLLRGQSRPARRHGAGRASRRAQGLAARADRRLYGAALPGLLAQGRSAPSRRARALSAARPRMPKSRSPRPSRSKPRAAPPN